MKKCKVLLFIILAFVTQSYSQTHGESEYIRVVSWNIEHLGKRSPLRTEAQRKLVGERILGMNAQIFLLQEIDKDSVFVAMVDHMNKVSEDHWICYGNGKQNAIVYNASELEIVESPGHWVSIDNVDYPQASFRPPVTTVFKTADANHSFRVIGIHAHYKDEQVRIAQAKWLNKKIESLLENPKETHNIILCGDYNTGGHFQDGLLHEFREGNILFNVPKENGPGTGWEKREESDYFTATSSALAKIKGGTCSILEPEIFHESFKTFEETYSDHFPVYIDCIME